MTPHIELLKPNEGEKQYELVRPSVHVGWIPNLPEDDVSIPSLTVGMEENEIDEDDGNLQVVITAAVSRYGITDKDGVVTYGMSGYKDLLNLMDKTAAAILRTRAIASNLMLSSSVKLSMYTEQPYPYWYGKLKFAVDTAGYPRTTKQI